MLGFLKRGAQRLGMGATGPLRGGVTGALCVQDAHAKYQEAVLSGNVWIGSNPGGTAVTPQTGLSATTPGLVLFNPINSPVNLVLWTFQYGLTAVNTAQNVICLAYNVPAVTGVVTGPLTVTNGNVTNALLSLGQAQQATAVQNAGAWGQCYRVSTLNAAPVVCRYSFTVFFGTSVGVAATMLIDNIDGAIVIPPGVAVSDQSLGAASAGVAAFCWEEVPISN